MTAIKPPSKSASPGLPSAGDRPPAAGTETGSVISRDICIEGDLEGQESLVVEGRLKGRLQTAGDVVVAAGGFVEATIVARNIVIHGRVNGNIEARESAAIEPQGILIGDCRARSIQIHEGARFEGRSEILN